MARLLRLEQIRDSPARRAAARWSELLFDALLDAREVGLVFVEELRPRRRVLERGETAYGLTKFATVAAGGQPPPLPPLATSTRPISDDEILAALRADGLLAAIRLYREKTGAGLAEAKQAMETWRAKLG